MIFHVTQRHTERTSAQFYPAIKALAEQGWPMEGVKVLGVYAAPHAHTWYYLVESETYESLWRGFSSFRELTTTEITPVQNVSPGQPFTLDTPSAAATAFTDEARSSPGSPENTNGH